MCRFSFFSAPFLVRLLALNLASEIPSVEEVALQFGSWILETDLLLQSEEKGDLEPNVSSLASDILHRETDLVLSDKNPSPVPPHELCVLVLASAAEASQCSSSLLSPFLSVVGEIAPRLLISTS